MDELERWNIRAYAAQTLWVVVAPGMVSALRNGLAGEHAELRYNAAYALYHLGAIAVIPDLLAAAASPDATLVRAATNELHALVDTPLLASSLELAHDWKLRAPSFQEASVIDMGGPWRSRRSSPRWTTTKDAHG